MALTHSSDRQRTSAQTAEVQHYLRTGETPDDFHPNWPGENIFERAEAAERAMKEALVAEVRARTRRARMPRGAVDLDIDALARSKVAPMVFGLFPRQEQAVVLDLLARSVVFLTPGRIAEVLAEADWLRTAWRLANLYLDSFGAKLLSDDAPRILGLSESTTCYVSVEYFRKTGRFEDFVVHEAAHVFHNCKRERVGLPHTRYREWLLPIHFVKRETFAFACEAYSRLAELGRGLAHRRALLDELAGGPMPNEERVDHAEYLDILREAVAARNGWKHILARCKYRPTRMADVIRSLRAPSK